MSFVTLTNILVMMLCAAVLVQSVRILRSFRNFNAVDLTATVTALDKSTAQARLVLSELKETLRGDCAGFARTLAESETLREELAMMIGIANAAAERIVETVDQQPRVSEPAPTPRKRRGGAEPKPERAAKQPSSKPPVAAGAAS